MITGSELIEKLYSEEYNEGEERLYSTGDEELDDLLEKAFSEGYEYFLEQREFGKRQKQNRKTARELHNAEMHGNIAMDLEKKISDLNIKLLLDPATNKKNIGGKTAADIAELERLNNKFDKARGAAYREATSALEREKKLRKNKNKTTNKEGITSNVIEGSNSRISRESTSKGVEYNSATVSNNKGTYVDSREYINPESGYSKKETHLVINKPSGGRVAYSGAPGNDNYFDVYKKNIEGWRKKINPEARVYGPLNPNIKPKGDIPSYNMPPVIKKADSFEVAKAKPREFVEDPKFKEAVGRRESVRSGGNTARGSVKPGTELSVDLAKVADEIPEAKTVEAREKLSKRLSDWANKHKKPLIGTGIGLATIGTGAYLYNKNKKKEK